MDLHLTPLFSFSHFFLQKGTNTLTKVHQRPKYCHTHFYCYYRPSDTLALTGVFWQDYFWVKFWRACRPSSWNAAAGGRRRSPILAWSWKSKIRRDIPRMPGKSASQNRIWRNKRKYLYFRLNEVKLIDLTHALVLRWSDWELGWSFRTGCCPWVVRCCLQQWRSCTPSRGRPRGGGSLRRGQIFFQV